MATGGRAWQHAWARFAIPDNRPTPKRADGTGYQLPPLLEPQPDHEWRVTRHWGSDGEEYRFKYDLERGETHVTDSLGRQDHYYWGPFYEIYKHIDPLGNCWQEEIIAGQLMKSVDPQGGEWSYSYDDIGRLAAGQLIAYTDPAQRITRLRYDRSGRLIQRIDALGHTVEFGYDAGMLKTYSYSLCLLLDEVVKRTTWGRLSSWSERSLPSQFHGETQGGEKFFTVMNNMIPEAARYQHVLEFMYQCLVSCLKRK